jgi:Potato inhibitor I family
MKDEEIAHSGGASLATVVTSSDEDDAITVDSDAKASAAVEAAIEPTKIEVIHTATYQQRSLRRWVILLAVLTLAAVSVVGFMHFSCDSHDSHEMQAASSSTLPKLQTYAPTDNTEPPHKTSWPELVGMSVEDAEAILLDENPNLQPVVAYPDTIMTMDLSYTRVILYACKETNVVTQVPRIG